MTLQNKITSLSNSIHPNTIISLFSFLEFWKTQEQEIKDISECPDIKILINGTFYNSAVVDFEDGAWYFLPDTQVWSFKNGVKTNDANYFIKEWL